MQQHEIAAPRTGFNADKYLDDEQAADLLGLSRSYLQKLRVRGGGPQYSQFAAKAIRYRVGDLLEWASSKAARSTSERAVA